MVIIPRGPREKNHESLIYHIIERGNERRDIFLEDTDRERFLKTLQRMLDQYKADLYAYCLMSNHVHLLIYSGTADISEIIKSLNISYVSYFNKKWDRCGHLFQDRFRSQAVDTDAYLLEVSRYIHLNPVKAGLVQHPVEYRWSSYRKYAGEESPPGLRICKEPVLQYFTSSDSHDAVQKYGVYIEEGIRALEEAREQEITAMAGESQEKINLTQQQKARLIIEEIAQDHMIRFEILTLRKTNHQDLRNLAMARIRQETSLSLREIGELFGGISAAAVTKALKMGSELNLNKHIHRM